MAAWGKGWRGPAAGASKFSAKPVIVTKPGLEIIERDTILTAAKARGIETVHPPTLRRKAPKPIRLIDIAALVGIDGEYFRSKKEAARYVVLRRREQGGGIQNLARDPRFILHTVNPQGLKVAITEYTGDFSYDEPVAAIGRRLTLLDTGEMHHVIEECKGMPTKDWELRKKWVEAEYGIRILVT